MNDEDFGVLLLVIVVAAFTFLFTWGFTDQAWKRDAIANHAAHYELNPENGSSTFVWGK